MGSYSDHDWSEQSDKGDEDGADKKGEEEETEDDDDDSDSADDNVIKSDIPARIDDMNLLSRVACCSYYR